MRRNAWTSVCVTSTKRTKVAKVGHMSLQGLISPLHVPPHASRMNWPFRVVPASELSPCPGCLQEGRRRRGGVTSSQPSTNSGVSRSTERWGAAESRRDGEWSWTFKTSRKTRRKRQPSNEMCVFDFQLNPDCELHHQGEFGSAWTRLIQSAQKSQELTSDRPEWLWSSDLLCSDVTVIRNKA